MTLIKLDWDYRKGEGSIKITGDFDHSDQIVRLDALVDWMSALQKLYHKEVESFMQPRTKNEPEL